MSVLLPVLTDEEYAALKSDIRKHGIMVPIILDEDDKIIDGVHRNRVAGELGIDPPVARREGLTEDGKLHLAVGLNMRRRHLDADRRRALVRSLKDERGLSVRKIADITGWGKSTVDRDLKPSPYESVFAELAATRERMAGIEDTDLREVLLSFTGLSETVYSRADSWWKQGAKPTNDERITWLLHEHMVTYELTDMLNKLTNPDHKPHRCVLCDWEKRDTKKLIAKLARGECIGREKHPKGDPRCLATRFRKLPAMS